MHTGFDLTRVGRRLALAFGVVVLAGAIVAPAAVVTAKGPTTQPPTVTQPVAPPPPGKASFAVQPSGGVAGVTWATQPVVTLSGADSRYRYYVTITLSGSGGGGLSCASTTVDMVSQGTVATGSFSGCKVSAAGTYSLRASVSGKAVSGGGVAPTVTATSASFKITAAPTSGAPAPVPPVAPVPPGVASFVKQPGGGPAGAVWAAQPVVRLSPADPAYRYAATIAIDTARSEGSGSLTCTAMTVTMTQASGATVADAPFTGCSISGPGTYVLVAVVSGVAKSGYGTTQPASTVSQPVYISGTAVPAAGMWFTKQPLGASASYVPSAKSGQAWSTQPVVSIFGTNGKVVSTDNQTVVTISIASGTPASGGPGVLACTGGTSVKVQAGVAKFSGCSIAGPGKGYALRAVATTALAATSYPFDISSPNGYLAYTTPVLDTTPGAERVATSLEPWPFEPVVTVFAPDGTVAATNNTTKVTLAIDPTSTGEGVLVCSSGTSVVAVDGVATFSGCAMRGTGDFRVVASASDPYVTGTIDPVTSGTFSVVAGTAGIQLYAQSTLVGAGAQAQLAAKLVGPTASTSYQTIAFQAMSVGDEDWVDIGTAKTNADGAAVLSTAPRFDTTYRATFEGTSDVEAATSNLVPVGVRPVVTVSPSDGAAVTAGKAVTYTVTVVPTPPASDQPPTVTFLVYENVGGVWTYRGEQVADVSDDGTAAVAWTWASAGSWAYSVRADAGELWRQGFTKAPVILTVK